jgi:hypothetical protein
MTRRWTILSSIPRQSGASFAHHFISGDLAMRSLFAMMIMMAALVVAGCNGDAADNGTTTTTTTPPATDTDGTTTPANGATDNP